MRRQRLWLCLPPLVLCVIDSVITALHQPPSYWQGYLERAREANPLVEWAMHQHQFGLPLITFAWILLFSTLLVWLPYRLALFAAIAITFGHGFMAGTWLHFNYPNGFYWALGLCMFAAALLAFCLPASPGPQTP